MKMCVKMSLQLKKGQEIYIFAKFIQLSCNQVSVIERTVKLDEKIITFNKWIIHTAQMSKCVEAKDTRIPCLSSKEWIDTQNIQQWHLYHQVPAIAIWYMYIHLPDDKNYGCWWVIALNGEGKGRLHNHPAPAEWKILPKVLEDISNTAMKNASITNTERKATELLINKYVYSCCKHWSNLNCCKKG